MTALAVAVGTVAADQLTKWWASTALEGTFIDVIPGVLRLAMTENTGAAFGFFRDGGTFVAFGALAAVVVILISFRSVERWTDVVALGLVMGGAVGNLVDRVARGEGLLDGPVVDWIDPSFFPTFNLADTAITIGVALMLLGALRTS